MRIRSPLLTKFTAWLLVTSLRLLFRTVRKELHVADQDTDAYNPDAQGRYLYCTWHDSIVLPLFMGIPYHMAALVSRHQDGSYLAESMRLLNVEPVRGSSNRGGSKAMREMIDLVQDYHLTITPDGPRGPRREMKEGVVFLASKAQRPIVPMAFCCENAWRFKGKWTDLVIPKPFSKVHLLVDEPIDVPDGLSREEVSDFTVGLQQVMDSVYDRVEGMKKAA